MWNSFKDIASLFFGAAFLFVSLFYIPEIRKSRRAIILTLFAVAVTSALGIDKLVRDNKTHNDNNLSRHALLSKSDSLLKLYRNDSARNERFLQELDKKFNIRRDKDNQPYRYNNIVNNPRDVYFDQR